MYRNLFLSVAFIVLAQLATAGPKGTVPKTSADRYAVHAEDDRTKIGAARISADEARKVFGFDVGRSCFVVEVALYPQKNKERKVSLDDFTLRIAGTSAFVKPSSATAATAARWQQQLSLERTTKVEPSGEVAVGTHGGHVEGQVDIEKGYDPPNPASDRDRAMLETELVEKGLPGGKVSSPVAGYIYFPILQKKSKLLFSWSTNWTVVRSSFNFLNSDTVMFQRKALPSIRVDPVNIACPL